MPNSDMFLQVASSIALVLVTVYAGFRAIRWVEARLARPKQEDQMFAVLVQIRETLAVMNEREAQHQAGAEPCIGILEGIDLSLKAVNVRLGEIAHAIDPVPVKNIGIAIAHMNERLVEIAENVEYTEVDLRRDERALECLETLSAAAATPRQDGDKVVAKALVSGIDEARLAAHNDSAQLLSAMDTLVDGFEKFRKQQASFLNAIFNSGSISTASDEDASKLEEIEALMRRYGLDRDAAAERVERKRVYEPNSGRGRMQAGV